jgi:hydrogenase maturation protein HypF
MKDDAEGVAELCDYILSHNRPIHMRADDSVKKIVNHHPLFLRRARGYVPYPQKVPPKLQCSDHILALGGELKDTISVYKNGHIVTSQFLGDLDEYQNYRYFEETIHHLIHLFKIQPAAVITDLHPNFHTTRHAQKMGLPHFQVQHHFAHVLAARLEFNIPPEEKILGVAWDGFGYGDDGSAWGSEFLIADYDGYSRIAHFRNVPLPGGDLAAKQPWRMAFAYLFDTFIDEIPEIEALNKVSRTKIQGLSEMIKKNINCPPTSSCGRLFDAVSFLLGLAPVAIEFEAEAPMRLEAAADPTTADSYTFIITKANQAPSEISFSPVFESILHDMNKGVPVSRVSSKFHNTLARVIFTVAEKANKEYGIRTVALTGGVFLNKKLLERTSALLDDKGYFVIRPTNYSPNDESISVGQIAYGLRLRNKS